MSWECPLQYRVVGFADERVWMASRVVAEEEIVAVGYVAGAAAVAVVAALPSVEMRMPAIEMTLALVTLLDPVGCT